MRFLKVFASTSTSRPDALPGGSMTLHLILSVIVAAVLVTGLVLIFRIFRRHKKTARSKWITVAISIIAVMVAVVMMAGIWRGRAEWVKEFYSWLRSNKVYVNIFWSLVVVMVVMVIFQLIQKAMLSRCEELEDRHRVRRGITWIRAAIIVFLVGIIWISSEDLGIFLGFIGAGLALSMQEVILCVAGWLLIIVKRPYDIGDRVEIDGRVGDVIDIRLFQTTLLEIGNWVNADQSTGRMVNMPNSAVFRKFTANYTKGFPFIWNELTIVITFESDWRRAKTIIYEQALSEAEKIEQEVQKKIEQMQKNYAIRYSNLTPIVYTGIADHGVALTLRYITPARKRRDTSHVIYEGILDAFAQEDRIDLAYPTTRFYDAAKE